MTARLLSSLALLSLLVGCADDSVTSPQTGVAPRQVDSWREFKSAQGRFEILLPSEPNYQSQDLKLPLGNVRLHMYLAETGVGTYLASYCDYPGTPRNYDAPRVLTGARDGVVAKMQAKLVSDKSVSLGTVPGREFLAQLPDNNYYRSRLYFSGTRLFQIVVAGSRDQVHAPEAERFLGSFQIGAR